MCPVSVFSKVAVAALGREYQFESGASTLGTERAVRSRCHTPPAPPRMLDAMAITSSVPAGWIQMSTARCEGRQGAYLAMRLSGMQFRCILRVRAVWLP